MPSSARGNSNSRRALDRPRIANRTAARRVIGLAEKARQGGHADEGARAPANGIVPAWGAPESPKHRISATAGREAKNNANLATDLSDAQRAFREPMLPQPAQAGRPRTLLRPIADELLHVA